MKKIAIIAPCILPVPASRGGAVEELITCIINQNEISKQYAIDLFTIADCSYDLKKYSYTNIIPISLDKFTSNLDRICDKYYRTIKNKSAKRIFDKQIVSTFKNRISEMDDSYYAVIIENQMSLAIELLKETGSTRDYPVFFHMHNDFDIYRTPEYVEILTNNGVQFIAVSEYIQSQILKYSSTAIVHVLHNGISMDDYQMTTRHSDGNVKFLYAGRIIDIKGIVELIEAFIKMRTQLPGDFKDRVFLDLVGFSDKPTAFEKQVFKSIQNYSDCIRCEKRLSTLQMAEKYNEYDVVVMPTLQEESFGLVALETIAKGIPLIATNSGGVPEVVGDGAIIISKEQDLVDNLASAMMKLATDEAFRTELGKKAFIQARRVVEFNINTYYYRLVDIIDTECSQNMISVIVPVYNVKNELARCVDSLINQSFREIEIILVDDGSTDSSGSICDKYAETDSRIKVIHQQNKGLSGARNTGIETSTGSYLFFLDSDDFLAEDALEKMLGQMRRCNADVVACGFAHVFDSMPERPFTSAVPGIWNGKEAVMQMMSTNNICTTAWNKLYRAELWRDVRFPEGKVHEDEATIYKLLYNAKIVSYMPDCFYKYYQRGNSIMNSGLEGRYGDYLLAMKERIQFFRDRKEQELADFSIMILLEYIKYLYRNIDNNKDLKAQYNLIFREYGIPKTIRIQKKVALILFRLLKI